MASLETRRQPQPPAPAHPPESPERSAAPVLPQPPAPLQENYPRHNPKIPKPFADAAAQDNKSPTQSAAPSKTPSTHLAVPPESHTGARHGFQPQFRAEEPRHAPDRPRFQPLQQPRKAHDNAKLPRDEVHCVQQHSED